MATPAAPVLEATATGASRCCPIPARSTIHIAMMLTLIYVCVPQYMPQPSSEGAVLLRVRYPPVGDRHACDQAGLFTNVVLCFQDDLPHNRGHCRSAIAGILPAVSADPAHIPSRVCSASEIQARDTRACRGRGRRLIRAYDDRHISSRSLALHICRTQAAWSPSCNFMPNHIGCPFGARTMKRMKPLG